MKHYVLDACAVIAFLREEEGSLIVKQLLKQKVALREIVYLHKATLA
jgi:PIN domain nuclease of toxin-antitoxin system